MDLAPASRADRALDMNAKQLSMDAYACQVPYIVPYIRGSVLYIWPLDH